MVSGLASCMSLLSSNTACRILDELPPLWLTCILGAAPRGCCHGDERRDFSSSCVCMTSCRRRPVRSTAQKCTIVVGQFRTPTPEQQREEQAPQFLMAKWVSEVRLRSLFGREADGTAYQISWLTRTRLGVHEQTIRANVLPSAMIRQPSENLTESWKRSVLRLCVVTLLPRL